MRRENVQNTIDKDRYCDAGEMWAISMSGNPKNITAITQALWKTKIPQDHFMQSEHQGQQASMQCYLYEMRAVNKQVLSESTSEQQAGVVTQFFNSPSLKKELTHISPKPDNEMNKVAFFYGFISFLAIYYKKQVCQATIDLVNRGAIQNNDMLKDLQNDPTTSSISLLTWLIKTKRDFSFLKLKYTDLIWKGNNTLFGKTSCSASVMETLSNRPALTAQ